MRPRRRELDATVETADEPSVQDLLASCERVCRSEGGAAACVVARGVRGGPHTCAKAQADCSSVESRDLTAVCLAAAADGSVDGSLKELSAQWSGNITAVAVIGDGAEVDDEGIFGQDVRHWRSAELLSVRGRNATALALRLESFPELSSLSLRGASLLAFPLLVFELPQLEHLDLRGNNFSRPLRFDDSERRYVSQLRSFAIDPTALDSECEDPWRIHDKYSVCDTNSLSSASTDTNDFGRFSKKSAGASLRSSGSSSYDDILFLPITTGSGDPSLSSSSGGNGNSNQDLSWVIVGGVFLLLCIIAFTAYCYTKYDKYKKAVAMGDILDDESSGIIHRFLSSRVRRRQSRRRASVDAWFDDPELRKWVIEPNLVVPLQQIGFGAYSTVWLAQYTSELVVLKRFRTNGKGRGSEISSQELHDAFAMELSLLASLSHPKIVALVGVAWAPPPPPQLEILDIHESNQDQLALVVEYMERGDLRSYLSATKETDLGWTRRKISIAADIAEAIAYLHAQSPPVLHRDVTSRNILLDGDYTAKLADFGLSRRLRLDVDQENPLAMTKGVGTSRWIAPEVLNGDGVYASAVDVYSFGVVLAELDSHEPPFCDVSHSNGKPLSDKTFAKLLEAGAFTPMISEDCPKPIATLMYECLSPNPEDRPLASYAASRLRAMLERLRRFSDVSEDVAGTSSSIIEMEVDGGILVSGNRTRLITNPMDSFMGYTYESGDATNSGSKRSASSQYSLMQDSS